MHIRRLRQTDFAQYISLTATSITEAEFQRFTDSVLGDLHKVFVVELDGKLVASATLLIEEKLTHDGCKFGHIENVLVAEDSRRKGIGVALVEFVIGTAEDTGCYRADLTCSEGLEKFYGQTGMKRGGITMRKLFPNNFADRKPQSE